MSTTRSQRSRTSATAAFFRPHCAHDARRLPTTAAGPPTDWVGLGGDPLHADVVPEPVYKDADGTRRAIQVPHTGITLRIPDSFRRKADVFDRYRRDDRVGKGDACSVAINLHDIPHAWADAQVYWFRALYGVGDMFITLDRALDGRRTLSRRPVRPPLAL